MRPPIVRVLVAAVLVLLDLGVGRQELGYLDLLGQPGIPGGGRVQVLDHHEGHVRGRVEEDLGGAEDVFVEAVGRAGLADRPHPDLRVVAAGEDRVDHEGFAVGDQGGAGEARQVAVDEGLDGRRLRALDVGTGREERGVGQRPSGLTATIFPLTTPGAATRKKNCALSANW